MRPVLAVTALSFVVIVFILVDAATERDKRRLVDTGQCEATTTMMYQPPPALVKSGNVYIHIAQEPYERTRYECAGGDKFWMKDE